MQQYRPHLVRIPFPEAPRHRHSRMFPILLANLVSSALTPRAPRRRHEPPVRASKGRAKPINLALQGGGAHGAFTWGVLDQLLDDERIIVEGLSATSAGAMNAAVFTYGYAIGGRAGAKQALAEFWRRVSDAARQGPLQPSWLDRIIGNRSLEFSPAFVFADL